MVFSRLLPFAGQYRLRIVIVNRRGYPGAAPITDQDYTLLKCAADGDFDGPVELLAFMRDRAREVYDLLADFVFKNNIPAARPGENAGGIVIAGWSLGASWMTALLANVASFPVGNVKLASYVRRVVLHGTTENTHLLRFSLTKQSDAAYHTLGYSPPSRPGDAWNPFMDTSISPDETTVAFAYWVSGYYSHGDTSDKLERRTPLSDPPPTITTMTPEERANVIPSECDSLLLQAGLRSGLFGQLRESALFLSPPKNGSELEERERDEWRAVEVRHVWCDQSVWELPYAAWALRAELDEAKLAGRLMRNVTIVRLKGGNHFVSIVVTLLSYIFAQRCWCP